MEENRDLKILTEIHKGAKMGMDSISFVAEKVSDETLKDDLSYQYTQYGQILDKVNKVFENYGEIPEENTIKDKVMGWTGIQMNTMNDKSNSKIAEILIQGTTMGIIEGRKLLNQNPNADGNVKNVLNEFVCMQENNVEKLKTFL